MDDPADHVVIDVTKAHFWDISAVGALDKVVERMRRNGRSVQVVGLNEASADLVDKLRADRQDRRGNRPRAASVMAWIRAAGQALIDCRTIVSGKRCALTPRIK